MVYVELFDDDDDPVPVLFDADGNFAGLPNEVSSIHISDDLQGSWLECKDLTMSLRLRPRKLDSLCIFYEEETALDPHYCSMLTIALKMTNKVEITPRVYDEHVDIEDSLCLSLMHGVMLSNGPRALEFDFGITDVISVRQAETLFEGIAYSTCLEKLHLYSLVCVDPQMATDAFVNALQENRSLKELTFVSRNFHDIEGIFRAAIKDTKIESLKAIGGELGFGTALDVLSSNDCRLQSLRFLRVDMSEIGDANTTTNNQSVRKLTLWEAQLLSSHLTYISSTFQSLTELHLSWNSFQDLSPLFTLLVGENLTLQRLSLGWCDIQEDSVICLFRKLPHMKCIRSIALHENPFLDSCNWMTALSNAIQQNTSLEELRFSNGKASSGERGLFYSKVEVSLGVNRAWRRHMENHTEESTTEETFPSNLWPLVLERATKISYVSCTGDRLDKTHLPGLKRDIVFWLLRERMDWAQLY